MRNYIFTDQEKKIIERYLEDGIRLEGFTVLKNRFYKAAVSLAPDVYLIDKFYQAIKEDAPSNVIKLIEKAYEDCPHSFGHEETIHHQRRS